MLEVGAWTLAPRRKSLTSRQTDERPRRVLQEPGATRCDLLSLAVCISLSAAPALLACSADNVQFWADPPGYGGASSGNPSIGRRVEQRSSERHHRLGRQRQPEQWRSGGGKWLGRFGASATGVGKLERRHRPVGGNRWNRWQQRWRRRPAGARAALRAAPRAARPAAAAVLDGRPRRPSGRLPGARSGELHRSDGGGRLGAAPESSNGLEQQRAKIMVDGVRHLLRGPSLPTSTTPATLGCSSIRASRAEKLASSTCRYRRVSLRRVFSVREEYDLELQPSVGGAVLVGREGHAQEAAYAVGGDLNPLLLETVARFGRGSEVALHHRFRVGARLALLGSRREGRKDRPSWIRRLTPASHPQCALRATRSPGWSAPPLPLLPPVPAVPPRVVAAARASRAKTLAPAAPSHFPRPVRRCSGCRCRPIRGAARGSAAESAARARDFHSRCRRTPAGRARTERDRPSTRGGGGRRRG